MANVLSPWRVASSPYHDGLGDAAARRAQLAALVRVWRERRGLSQRELADAVSVSQSLVSLIESPSRTLSVGRERLLDVLRAGLGMTRAEVDACCWLAGRALLSDGEARQLFGPAAPPAVAPEVTARAMLMATAGAAAPRRRGRALASAGRWSALLAGVGLLLAGITIGLALAAQAGPAQAVRARTLTMQQLDLWGWVSYRQEGTPGARTFDTATGGFEPLAGVAQLADLAACPTSRALVGVAERTPAGVVARIVDGAGGVRWTASRPAARAPNLSWNASCAALVFRAADEQLLALAAADGSERPLARLEPGTQAAAAAPQAGVLAWVGGDGVLRVRRDGEPTQVVNAADAAAATPAWATDGQRLAWLGPAQAGGRPLLVYTLRTGQWRRVGQVDASAHTLAWPPSGQGIAFAVREGEQDRVVIRAFSGETLPLFTVAGPPLAGLTWNCGHAPHPSASEGP